VGNLVKLQEAVGTFRKGESLKLSVSHKREEWRYTVDKETEKRVVKIQKLLKHYDPDLVMLHGTLDKHAKKEEYSFVLNLSLPTGTLHATGEDDDVSGCIKRAFKEIETQIKKHVSLIRKDYEWKRKRPRAAILAVE
jgi:ribosome-associated translation inhibitor RaiA